MDLNSLLKMPMATIKKTFDKNFWFATFSLVGTTIGAGIFGLPFIFWKSGFWLGFLELGLLAFSVALVQLMAGEISLRIKSRRRIMGFGDEYLGNPWKKLFSISVLSSNVGAILAYIILAGDFLSLISGLDSFFGSTIFFVILFIAIAIRMKIFGRLEMYLSCLSIFLIIFLAGSNFDHINLGNLSGFNLGNFLVPYGVILFSVTGISAIPLMEDLLAGEKKKLKRAIVAGTLIPAATYLIFIIAVAGISGGYTSPDAVSGLSRILNSQFVLILGSLIGLIAVSEAALSLGLHLKETFQYDLKMNKGSAWFLAGALPFALFLIGARNFIDVVGVIGAVFLGFQMIMILWIHRLSKKSGPRPEYQINFPGAAYWILGAIMALGAVLEVWHHFG